jgi:hypothetical protein
LLTYSAKHSGITAIQGCKLQVATFPKTSVDGDVDLFLKGTHPFLVGFVVTLKCDDCSMRSLIFSKIHMVKAAEL